MIKRPVYILGINLSDHDRSVCLLKDGSIACAIANERLDRRKHSFGCLIDDPSASVELPTRAIVYCLGQEKIGLDRIDLIVVGRSIFSPLRHARQILPVADSSKIVEIPFPGHHLSHALSAYYCSPFKKAAVVVADQMGSFIQQNPKIYEKHSLYCCEGTNIRVIDKYFGTDDDLSLGLFYDYFTNGFEFVPRRNFCGHAGKLMGLSAYGKKVSSFPELIKIDNGNTVILKHDLYRFFKKTGLEIDHDKFSLNGCVTGVIFKMRSDTDMGRNLAYKAQEELENALLRIVDYAYKKTRCENLCLAGGIALNCIANGKIIGKSRFKNVFIQPGGMDDGTAIGLAFYGWHHVYRKQKRFVLKNAYLGRPYTSYDLAACLKEYPFNRLKKYWRKRKNIFQLAASLVAQGKVVGWFQGASEFGPRALGHRSILADPRVEAFKDILNRKKGRELFRPFAASILLESCAEYFDVQVPSPFMLIAAQVKDEKKQAIPAVVHVDGTTRIQTVTKEDNESFYDVIREFRRITGIPLVLNTSFNAHNEPLVETPQEAIRSFFKMELDCLIIDDHVLDRQALSAHLIRKITSIIDDETGEALTAGENLKRTEQIYRYTARDVQKLGDLKLMRARHYTERRLFTRALGEYKAFIAQFPDHPGVKNGDIFESLGKLYFSQGRHTKAIREFLKKEKLDPQNIDIQKLMARCYKAAGQTKKFNKTIYTLAEHIRTSGGLRQAKT